MQRNSSNAGGAPCMRSVAELVAVVEQTWPNLASQMRVAFSSIAANTGARSPGDVLMTLSTSDVAVCCSSDFTQLVEQPRVLDGDHRLRGEVLHQLDLLVGERPHLVAVDDDDADQLGRP